MAADGQQGGLEAPSFRGGGPTAAPAPRRGRARPDEQRIGRRPIMTDVARLAGCSQSTVSIVLNDTAGIQISEATRARVFEAARELDYRLPARAALAGLAARHETIAFVVDRLSTSLEALVSIEGAREAAWPTGHILTVTQTFNDAFMERHTLEYVLGQRPAGIIYATIMTRAVEVPPVLRNADLPVVLLNCYDPASGLSSVVPGEVAGGRRATEHLLDAGHRRIGTIQGEAWMEAARDRLEGYRQALAAARIAFDPELVRPGNWLPSAGYAGTQALLDLADPPTAIFCQNDRMAIGAYEAIKERGLSIPNDVSIVGFDDDEVARHLSPLLTTLILPHREMGRWAVETLLSAGARRRKRGGAPLKLECALVERNSVAPLAG